MPAADEHTPERQARPALRAPEVEADQPGWRAVEEVGVVLADVEEACPDHRRGPRLCGGEEPGAAELLVAPGVEVQPVQVAGLGEAERPLTGVQEEGAVEG